MTRGSRPPRIQERPREPTEADRVRRVYDAYDADSARRTMWEEFAGSRYEKDRKWEEIGRVLSLLPPPFSGAWAIDLGAESGRDSARLKEAIPGLRGIVALDLRRERLDAEGGDDTLVRPLVADGAQIPLQAASVGLVYQSVMLSSILAPAARLAIYEEIRRVLVPGGVFLSYDTRYPNPWNPNTRRVSLSELRAAFPEWSQASHSLTVIPQLLRLLAPWSLRICRMVEAVPALRSHRLFAACKPGRVDAPVPTAPLSATSR